MKTTIVAIGIALAVATGAWAARWDKKTVIELGEPILIPGKQLPPGKYVMKLLDSQSNRHIVQIFNEDESKLEATILAIPNSRLQPTGKTALGYWETPSGTPPALRSWFYPGDNFGQEFAYPKATAERISKTNRNVKVPWFEGEETSEYQESGLRQAEVHDFDESGILPETGRAAKPADQTQAAGTQERASSAAVNESGRVTDAGVASRAGESTSNASKTAPKTSEAAANSSGAAANTNEAVSSSSDQTRRGDPTVMAQNRPQAGVPQSDEQRRAPMEDNNDTLPQTASPYGALLLVGLGLIGVGRVLGARRSI